MLYNYYYGDKILSVVWTGLKRTGKIVTGLEVSDRFITYVTMTSYSHVDKILLTSVGPTAKRGT